MSGLQKTVWGWRGAASGVVQRLKHFLDTEERSDVQFVVGRQGNEKLFRAHKFALVLGSDVFDRMFHGDIPQSTEKPIELPDILPEAFAVMLKYLYTDVVEDLTLENVVATLYCATKYGIPKLVDICIEYAVLTVDKSTCLDILEAAKDMDAENLVTKCLEIVDAHCTELLQSQGFLQLKSDTVREIFSRDTLMVNEAQVCKAAQRWATHVCQFRGRQPNRANYRALLGEALFAVRFPLMDDEQLAKYGDLIDELLLNDERLKIYQFKHVARKPDIPFSGIPRSPQITFSGRLWKVLDQSDNTFDGMFKTSASNVFLDELGRLHLRFTQHEGVWKGAGIQLRGALGIGRYTLHIEGLDRLDSNVGFSMYSQAENKPGAGIEFAPDGSNVNGRLPTFSVRRPNSVGPFGMPTAFADQRIPVSARSTLSFSRRSDSVTFRIQRDYQLSTAAVLCSWSYYSRPDISQEALPLFICLTNRGVAPSDGKDVEIVVRGFHFRRNEWVSGWVSFSSRSVICE